MGIQLECQEPCSFPEQEQNPPFLLEALYCEEEKWDDEEDKEDDDMGFHEGFSFSKFPSQQDLFWEDEELVSLFIKEQEQQQKHQTHFVADACVSLGRTQAVDWILKVNAHYGFTALTAVLAINYIDRFLYSYHFETEKPWMVQLLAATCLSLAAKIEETQVPLLLDLQVLDTKYVFKPKTIQRMELVVLSTLGWKMHPITPIGFLDHIVRRLGLKNNLHWNFLRRCESLLLSAVSDPRFVGFLPSVLATATMMHVIEQVEPFNPIVYQNELLAVLNLTKDNVMNCYELILELLEDQNENENPRKRKNCNESMLSSSSCVIDPETLSSDGSKPSSPEPQSKKIKRVQEESTFNLLLPITRGIVASP